MKAREIKMSFFFFLRKQTSPKFQLLKSFVDGKTNQPNLFIFHRLDFPFVKAMSKYLRHWTNSSRPVIISLLPKQLMHTEPFIA